MSGTIQVPEKWTSKNLVDVIQPLQNGNRPKGGAKGITEGIPSIGGEHLNYNGKFNFGNIKFIPTEFFKKQTRGIIKLSDILVVKDGATTGKTSFVDETFPYPQACVNEHVFILRTNGLIISKYLFYYIRSNFAQKKILEKTKGDIGGINTKFVKDFPIVFPENKETQKQIVAKLDHILGELEVKKKEILLLIEQNKKGINFFEKNWMSYVIDREIEKHPQRKEWEIKTAKELFYIKGRIGWKGLKKSDFLNEGPFLVTGVDIKNGKIDWGNAYHIPMNKFLESPEIILQKEDILLTKDGTIGKIAYVENIPDEKASINAHIQLIRNLKNNMVLPRFTFYVLHSNHFLSYVKKVQVGSTRPSLTQKHFENLTIPLPPIPIQKQIIQNIKNSEEKFQSQKKQFENIKNNYESKIKYINHIQSSILDSAFSGKLLI